MRNINELPECPVATTISLVGNKWKLLIIRNLTKKHGDLMSCKSH